MAGDIGEWLAGLGLERYTTTFVDNEIDIAALPYVTDADLEALGVALGARRMIVAEAALVGRSASTAARAERRQVTLVFCDLVGSTELSQRLDPEDLRELMGAYQDAVVGAVHAHGGHIANYLGDGVLACFGWPRAYEDQAERAVRAAMLALERVTGVRPPGPDSLAGRVGIATGTVVVGDLVGEQARDIDAVIGETPNLAARLEGLAERGQVVIDGRTFELLRDRFVVDDLGEHALKGFAQPVRCFAVLGERRSGGSRGRRGALGGIVGRTDELRFLEECWAEASRGRGRTIAISGDAGIGKSRLVEEICGILAPEPHLEIRLQCSPHLVNSAYRPILERLERVAGIDERDSPSERLTKMEHSVVADAGTDPLTAHLMAALVAGDTSGLPELAGLTPPELRHRTAQAVIGQVLALSRQRPVVLTVEDAHWLDPSTAALLGELIRQVDDAPILVIATHRPGEGPAWLDDPTVRRMALERLPPAECAAIVRSIAEGEIDASLVAGIVDRADGNPLFVEELSRAVLKTGTPSPHAVRTAERAGGDGIPGSLQDSLMARLDRLGPSKDLAQVCSAIGRDFDVAVVAAVLERPVATVVEQMQPLVEADVIDEHRDDDSLRYSFRHALVQEAAHGSMLGTDRRELHRRVAETLTANAQPGGGANPEVIARHWDLAGRTRDAAQSFELAGRRAVATSANLEAISHLEEVLDRLTAFGPDERDDVEFRVRVALGVALTAARGYASSEVERNYLRARDITPADASTDESFAIARGLWNCYFDRGDLQRSRALAASLMELADRGDNDLLRAFASRAVGSVELMTGDMNAAGSALEAGIEAARRWGREVDLQAFGEDPGLICSLYLSWTKTAQGRVADGLRHASAAAASAREIGHPLTIAFADTLQVVTLAWAGDFDGARRVADPLERFCIEHDLVFWQASAQMYRGWCLMNRGEPAAGLALAVDGLERWRATGAELHVPTFQRVILEGHLATGDLDAARATAEAAIRSCGLRGENLHLPDILRLRAACALADDDGAKATAWIEQAIGTAQANGAPLFALFAAEDLARHRIASGDVVGSLAALAPALDDVEPDPTVPAVARCLELRVSIERLLV